MEQEAQTDEVLGEDGLPPPPPVPPLEGVDDGPNSYTAAGSKPKLEEVTQQLTQASIKPHYPVPDVC